MFLKHILRKLYYCKLTEIISLFSLVLDEIFVPKVIFKFFELATAAGTSKNTSFFTCCPGLIASINKLFFISRVTGENDCVLEAFKIKLLELRFKGSCVRFFTFTFKIKN